MDRFSEETYAQSNARHRREAEDWYEQHGQDREDE